MPDAELMKGVTPVLVMQAIAAVPRSGLQILDAIALRSGGELQIPQGTIYPLLYRLEKQGLIRGRWQAGDGHRRERVYELSDRGTRTLAERRRECLQLADAMKLLLGRTA